MKIKFFDSNVYLGKQMLGTYKSLSNEKELLNKMDGLEIDKALVWHIIQFDSSPQEGNRLITGAVKGSKRLFGSWTVLPPQTEEVIKKDFFAQMKKNNIKALMAFPVHHRFLLNRAVFGKFFDEVTKRKIPLILSIRAGGTTWEMVYQLMAEYPALTCILNDIGIWGVDRYTFPLLENYKNVYLETSCLSLHEGSFDMTAKKYGADRLVFGSGFPEKYHEASMLDLLHSNISDADKAKVASKNMERIISRVTL